MNKTEAYLQVLGLNEVDITSTEKMYGTFKKFKELKGVMEEFEKKTLKPALFKTAETFGRQTPNGGHKVVLEDGSGFEKQARNSVSVDNEKALDLVKTIGKTGYVDTKQFITEDNLNAVINVLNSIGRADLITKEEAVTEKSLEQLYLNGEITDEQLTGIIDRKVTYALVEVKPKKK